MFLLIVPLLTAGLMMILSKLYLLCCLEIKQGGAAVKAAPPRHQAKSIM